ncbi:MAG: sigma-70 family polymerase sigma factor [Akkermansiaceae bacterium]|nr:sigma-70 family polymerase sigma factor [Akkermansiaceae bacterium]
MDHLPDRQLLESFITTRDEVAFRALVKRHLALVHGVARRVTASEDLARDVAQETFIRLARRAALIPQATSLPAWLHRVARHAAIDLMRAEMRRKKREQTASSHPAMSDDSPEPAWEALAPVVDELVDTLPAADREMLVARFYHNETHGTIAGRMGLSEALARKRTSRALEKLRVLLGKRGIATSSSALAMLLPAHAATPAPAALMATVVSAAQGVAPLVPGGLHAAILAMNATQKSLVAGAAALFLVSFGYAVRPVATEDAVATSSGADSSHPPQVTTSTRSPRIERPLPPTPEGRMERLGEILKIGNSAARRRETISFIDRLPPAEFEAAWKLMNSEDSDHQRFETERSLLASVWTKVDAPGALAAAEKSLYGYDRDLMRALGVNDPATGLAWLQARSDSKYYDADLLAGMAAADLPAAVKFLMSLPAEQRSKDLYLMYTTMDDEPGALQKLWEAMGPGPERTEMLVKAAPFGGGGNPATIMAALEKDPVALGRADLSQLYYNWALSDPAAAAESLGKLPESQRGAALDKTTTTVAMRNGPAAGDEILTRFPDQRTDERVRAVILAGSQGHEDEALDLLPGISDPAKRQEAMTMILQNWQTANPAAAQDWMKRHNLPPAAPQSSPASKTPRVIFR